MKLTKKEIEFLNQITKSDYKDWSVFNDGTSGVGDYVFEPNYNMKITRGLITSLNKKGVLYIGEIHKDDEGQNALWVSINPEYLDFQNGKLKEVA